MIEGLKNEDLSEQFKVVEIMLRIKNENPETNDNLVIQEYYETWKKEKEEAAARAAVEKEKQENEDENDDENED